MAKEEQAKHEAELAAQRAKEEQAKRDAERARLEEEKRKAEDDSRRRRRQEQQRRADADANVVCCCAHDQMSRAWIVFPCSMRRRPGTTMHDAA